MTANARTVTNRTVVLKSRHVGFGALCLALPFFYAIGPPYAQSSLVIGCLIACGGALAYWFDWSQIAFALVAMGYANLLHFDHSRPATEELRFRSLLLAFALVLGAIYGRQAIEKGKEQE